MSSSPQRPAIPDTFWSSPLSTAHRRGAAIPDGLPFEHIWHSFLSQTRVLDILRPDYYLIFRFTDTCHILHQCNLTLDLGGSPVTYATLTSAIKGEDLRFLRTADEVVINMIRARRLGALDLIYRVGANVCCANEDLRRVMRTCMLIHTGADAMIGLMCFHNVTRSVAGLRAQGVELLCRSGLECLQRELDDRLAASRPMATAPTPRELEIIGCLREGMSSKQIADALSITKNTVDTHRQNMLRKWRLPNTAALLHKAMSEGWGGRNHDKSA
jgi:DNA-binding CsgD family transcriptional regulator